MDQEKDLLKLNKCINIDWLEVYANELEPSVHDDMTVDYSTAVPKDAQYFIDRGFMVKLREYGTPQYRMMFTILDQDGREWIEVRRDPYSLRKDGGIFEIGDCHIRLSNRTCYAPSPIDELRLFFRVYGYRFKSITRIDLALDFCYLDDGTLPEIFAKDYVEDKYYKVHLSKVHIYGKDVQGADVAIHGRDSFVQGKRWNSLKWGSPTSAISVKLYNKTLELQESKLKWYIVDQWKAYMLPMDITDVWRIEFSIKSEIKDFVRLDDGTLIHSAFSSYDTPLKLMHMWMILAKKYFLFKKKVYTRNGTLQRKDRCPDYFPIHISARALPYKRVNLSSDTEPTRMDKILLNKLEAIINNPNNKDWQLKSAANELTRYFVLTKRMHEYEDNVKNFIDHWQNETIFTKKQVKQVFDWAEAKAQEILGIMVTDQGWENIDPKLQQRIIETKE